MKARRFLPLLSVIFLLLFGAARANACYGEIEGIVICTECGDDIGTTHCFYTACAGGSFCATSYGQCCINHNYREQNITGYCDSDPNECQGPVKAKTDSSIEAGTKFTPRLRASAARGDVAPRVVLVPSKCSGTYSIVDPLEKSGHS